jgi:hypothetical protein
MVNEKPVQPSVLSFRTDSSAKLIQASESVAVILQNPLPSDDTSPILGSQIAPEHLKALNEKNAASAIEKAAIGLRWRNWHSLRIWRRRTFEDSPQDHVLRVFASPPERPNASEDVGG